jgi:photosystem II stability/assembly factor-like uncharacterized protein
MTLHTLNHLSRKFAVAGLVVATSLFTHQTDLLAQKKGKQEVERGERQYGPKVHEMRQRMITDPATSGDIKDYYEVRKFGYNAWREYGSSSAFKSLAMPAWNQVSATGSQSGHTSGRARTIAFHPTDPNTVWIGSAQGGIWRTNEIYAESPKWVNLSENLPTLAMGAIAVDPKNPDIIFAGTGETNGGYSTPSGQGLFRSTNGGLDWKLVLAPDSAATTKAGAGYNCSQIVIDPKDSKRIYVATANSHGLVRSTDGGDSWQRVTPAVLGIQPVSIVINPNETNRLVISGLNGKVFRTEDGGDNWIDCKFANSNRIQLALWDAQPNIIYAAVLKLAGTTQIWRTEDHGNTWTLQCEANAMSNGYPDRSSKKVNYLWNNSQGSYAHSLAVDPVNGNILAGGLFIVFSSASDKGVNLNVRTNNNSTGGASDYVHADIQYLAFNTDGKLFSLSDGGINYASANGTGWYGKPNQNIGTLQFVGVDADRAFTFVVGGTQDNGTNKAFIGTDQHWKEIRGGDGGIAKVSQEDPSVVFGTSIGGDFRSIIFRSNTGGADWMPLDDGSFNIACNPKLKTSNGLSFYPKYDISANANVVAVAGASTVFVDNDGGLNCFPVEGKVGSSGMGGRPEAIHIAPFNEFMMWAAVSRNIFYTLDQGETWTKVAANNFSGAVSDITSDVSNPQLVYAVSAGASTTPGKSFARSADGGKTWEFPASQLPSIPTWSVAKSTKTGTLFIGTDFGVMYSLDNGTTWMKLGDNLPMSQVLSLEVRGTDQQWLLAGTFGRGAYYIDITNLPTSGVQAQQKHTIAVGKSYPNPVTAGTSEVKVDFSLEKAGLTQMILHDALGRDVMTLAKDHYPAGQHSVTIPVAELEAGTYFYSLTSDGQTLSDKLVVTK